MNKDCNITYQNRWDSKNNVKRTVKKLQKHDAYEEPGIKEEITNLKLLKQMIKQ